MSVTASQPVSGCTADSRLTSLTGALTIVAMTLMLAEILTEVICTAQMGGRRDRALWNRPFADIRPGDPERADAYADNDSIAKRTSQSLELGAL